MGSHWKRFVQDRGGSPAGATGSWEKRAAALYGADDEPGQSGAEMLSHVLEGEAGSQGSWAKRLIDTDDLGPSSKHLLTSARAPLGEDPGEDDEPGIADGLAGLTCAISLSRNLVSTFEGDRHAMNGDKVTVAYDQSGEGNDFQHNIDSARPTLTTVGSNARSALKFAGGQNFWSNPAGDLIGNTEGYIIIAAVFDAITRNNANSEENDPLISDEGGYMGILGKNTGGAGERDTVYAYNYDTEYDEASDEIVFVGTPYILEWKHEGGNISLRVNGGTWVHTPSGSTWSGIFLEYAMQLARTFSNTANVTVVELITRNDVGTEAEQDALVQSMFDWLDLEALVLHTWEAGFTNGEVSDATAEDTHIATLRYLGPGFDHWELTEDADGQISLSGNNVLVSPGFSGSYEFIVRGYNGDGDFIEDAIGFEIVADSVAPAQDPPPDDGDIEDDDTFEDPPVVIVVDEGIKFKGKKGSGSSGKFIYDIGAPVAGTIYTMRYDPDFSLLENSGVTAMVGFGLKQGNNFNLAGLKGDGSTGLKAYRVHGSNWTETSGFTNTDGGAAQHGTQAGPNWLQIEISADGATYTLRTSSDGETWADEFTDVVPAPHDDVVADYTQFGIAVFLEAADAGNFSVKIDLWITAQRFSGALAHRITSEQTIADNTTTPIEYNGEDYDTDGIHDPSTNPSRFTVPAILNGRRGRMSGGLWADTNGLQLTANTLRDGAAFFGQGPDEAEASDDNSCCWATALIPLTAGQYFENTYFTATSSGASGVPADVRNWGCFEVAPSARTGVLLKTNAAQSVVLNTPRTMSWASAEYDDHGLWASGDPTKIVIPASLNGKKLRFSAAINAPIATGFALRVSILKNGANEPGLPSQTAMSAGSDFVSLLGAPIIVATGDEFTVLVETTDTSSRDIPTGNNVWFQAEVMPDDYRGALLKRNTSQSVTAGVGATLAWEEAVYDTDGFWNIADPSVLVAPAGKVRVIGNARPTTTTLDLRASIEKNGSNTWLGTARQMCGGAHTFPPVVNSFSAIVEAADGDEFGLFVVAVNTENFGNNQNWLAIEVIS